MLELLSLRKGTRLSKAVFLDHLYGGADEPDRKIIDVFICKLRKKRLPPAVTITSKRFGAVATVCANPPGRGASQQ